MPVYLLSMFLPLHCPQADNLRVQALTFVAAFKLALRNSYKSLPGQVGTPLPLLPAAFLTLPHWTTVCATEHIQ